jgi:hypothetical protein
LRRLLWEEHFVSTEGVAEAWWDAAEGIGLMYRGIYGNIEVMAPYGFESFKLVAKKRLC